MLVGIFSRRVFSLAAGRLVGGRDRPTKKCACYVETHPFFCVYFLKLIMDSSLPKMPRFSLLFCRSYGYYLLPPNRWEPAQEPGLRNLEAGTFTRPLR